MKKEEKHSAANKMLMLVGGTALTVAGFIIIPPLLKTYSNKIYKASLKREDIDFDSMGPEIVQPNNLEGENNDYRYR